MEATVKKQTAFRFDSELLDLLKSAAKREHRSLNNYVECLLRCLFFFHFYIPLLCPNRQSIVFPLSLCYTVIKNMVTESLHYIHRKAHK